MAGLNKTSKLIGANEDMFLQAFDSTPKLNIATQKRLENELARVIGIISNTNAEWDQRVQAMKIFRSLVNSGIADQDDFYSNTLRNLEIPFQSNVCDLRSQVVRETCITIAFLSCRLQQKFSRMAEILLPSLIKLIPNCAKIVSTSALVALRFIIQSTHSSKFITIIKYQLSTSKSKEIHRALCEIIERIATLWPPQIIERQMNDFLEVLKLGICDSDEMARQYSRRAFNAFAEHFREHADRLFNSLDGQRQRMLNNLNHGGGSTLSMNGYGGSATSGLNTIGITSSSSAGAANLNHLSQQHHTATTHQAHHYGQQNSHHHVVSSGYGQTAQASRLKSSLAASSNGNSSASSSASSGSSIPPPPAQALSHVYQINSRTTASPSRIRTPTARSTSAIDVDAQRRARARAVYLNSVYRPRQLGGPLSSMNNNNNTTLGAPATPPVKSNLPQPIHSIHAAATASPYSGGGPNNSTASGHLSYKTSTAANPSTPSNNQSGLSAYTYHTPLSSHRPNMQYSQLSGNHSLVANSASKLPQQQQQQLSQPSQPPIVSSGDQSKSPITVFQHQAAALESKQTCEAMSKAAAYLLSVMQDSSIDESQIVTTIKYFNTLIDKNSPESVSRTIGELMPPLTVGIDNAAISVRKATVFAMVAIYAKVGLDQMESYLTSLTTTQRRLLEVYIQKHDGDLANQRQSNA